MRPLLALIFTIALLALPSVAGAQATPEDDVYDPVDVKRQADSALPQDDSALPLTGRDLGITLLAGVALVGTGVAVRRGMRSDSA